MKNPIKNPFNKEKKPTQTTERADIRGDFADERYEDLSEDEHLTPEEAQARIAMILADTKNPEILSELNQEEIAVLASMQTIAEKYNLTLIQDFIQKFLLLRVSHKRQGRKEVIQISQGRKEEDRMKRTLKSMVLGLK
jgi:hypothetical protein